MDQNQPIITTELEVMNGEIGYGKKVIASLYLDRIDMWKGNELKYQIKLSDIDSVKYLMGGGVLKIRTKEPRTISLVFVVMRWRLLGLLGYYLSGGIKSSKLWRNHLEALGINRKSGIFIF